MRKLKSAAIGVGIAFNPSYGMREKLLAEIASYEYEQSQLKMNGSHINFTLIQTYKELIAARREMLARLPMSF